MRAKSPETIIKLAVRRMLPKNKLGSKMLMQLKVYAGPDHPHQAQNPKKFDVNA
jgi:large subunit ribosomal protein L13